MGQRSLACVIALCLTARVNAQSFNIDVGADGSPPSSEYAAAGLPGFWNVVQIPHLPPFMTGPHPNAETIVDIDGRDTGVVIHQFGGMDLNAANNEATTGDDEALLDDYFATHFVVLETCVYINGLEPGAYEVTTYAWMPQSEETLSKIRFDFDPFNYQPLIGGAWPGSHVEGVTFSRHVVTVSPGSFIGLHVGIPNGGSTTVGVPLNGIQIRQLPDDAPADMNCDGAVNGNDIDNFVMALLDEPAYRSVNPTCNIYHGDMNNNGSVGPEDIAAFVGAALAG